MVKVFKVKMKKSSLKVSVTAENASLSIHQRRLTSFLGFLAQFRSGYDQITYKFYL